MAYLLPILNKLFHYKEKNPHKANPKFRLTKDNEDSMFLNAEEIAYKAQKDGGSRRLSFSRGGGSDEEPKGAIVLSYSKELLN